MYYTALMRLSQRSEMKKNSVIVLLTIQALGAFSQADGFMYWEMRQRLKY